MIYTNLETESDLIQRNEIVKIRKNLLFLLISPNKDLFCSGIQTYFSRNNNYLSTILWCFSSITPLEAKIIEILVMSVIKTTDVSKLFLVIFERTYNGLYICYFLCLQHVSINSNDRRCDFALPHLKRALKNPIKNALNAVWKYLSVSSFFNICGFCVFSFKCSIN